MSLQDILNINGLSSERKLGMSKERFEAIEPELRKYIAFWRD
jgi:hypothetical protein